MKNILLVALALLPFIIKAQQTQEIVLRMPIGYDDQNSNDSIAIVSVQLPLFSNISIKEKTLGVLHKNYKNSPNYLDSIVAVGRCYLIKGQTYYFGLKIKYDVQPQNGDIISFKVTIPLCNKGLLYEMSRQHIAFTTVDDKAFYNIETPFLLTKPDEETKYYNHMIKDIVYTAAEMVKQMPDANKEIADGMYKGVKLFDAMQKTTIKNLQSFFKYIQARPLKYAANTWKISEIYATWLDAGSPSVPED